MIMTAQRLIGFLHKYGLEKDFKLNVEVNHASMLPSIPASAATCNSC